MEKYGEKNEFYEIIQIIIQRLLLVLMVDLKMQNSMSEKHLSAFNSLKNNEINMEEILLLNFLRFINKNCKILVENEEDHCFKIEEKLPYLFLFLDELERLVFFSPEKESSDYFEKKEIDFIIKLENINKNGEKQEKNQNNEDEDQNEIGNSCFLNFLKRNTKKLQNIEEFNEEDIKSTFLEKAKLLKKKKKEELCKKEYDDLKAKLKEFEKKMDTMKFNTLEEINNFLLSFK